MISSCKKNSIIRISFIIFIILIIIILIFLIFRHFKLLQIRIPNHLVTIVSFLRWDFPDINMWGVLRSFSRTNSRRLFDFFFLVTVVSNLMMLSRKVKRTYNVKILLFWFSRWVEFIFRLLGYISLCQLLSLLRFVFIKLLFDISHSLGNNVLRL